MSFHIHNGYCQSQTALDLPIGDWEDTVFLLARSVDQVAMEKLDCHQFCPYGLLLKPSLGTAQYEHEVGPTIHHVLANQRQTFAGTKEGLEANHHASCHLVLVEGGRGNYTSCQTHLPRDCRRLLWRNQVSPHIQGFKGHPEAEVRAETGTRSHQGATTR